MSDETLALSILRKFAAGVHTYESNWLDPDGTLDGRFDPTTEERDLLARLNHEETAKAEAAYEQEQRENAARYGVCEECGKPRHAALVVGGSQIVCSVNSRHRAFPAYLS